MALTPLEQQLLAALIGLRGSHNGHEADWCGEAPHEDDCQAALDAVAAAKKAGAVMICPACGKSALDKLRGDGICDDCYDAGVRYTD